MPYPPLFNGSLDGIPCFNVSGARGGQLEFPNLIFNFTGGAKLNIPWQSLLHAVDDDVLRMCVQQTPGASFMGNKAQRDFHLSFDSKNNIMSFVKTNCTMFH